MTVTDSDNRSATQSLSIRVAGAPLEITTTSLPGGMAGTAYSQALTATGGAGGNQWSLASGALPAGLSLSAAGAIGGTPAAAGSSNFTVQVKDSSNAVATKPLSIRSRRPLTVATVSLSAGIAGTLLPNTGRHGWGWGNQWSIAGGALPPGLSLDPSGAITGTPTAAGSSNFTVQVKDAVNTIATKPLSIAISAPALTITTATLPAGVTGVAYSQTLAATGGAGGNQWSVTTGALPAGLSLSPLGSHHRHSGCRRGK